MSPDREGESPAQLPARADWNIAKPAELPRPTWFPAATAFGLAFFLWGFATSPVVLAVGLFSMVAALIGWMGELRRVD